MEAIKLNVNQLGEWAPKLHAGDRVLLSGTVYTLSLIHIYFSDVKYHAPYVILFFQKGRLPLGYPRGYPSRFAGGNRFLQVVAIGKFIR